MRPFGKYRLVEPLASGGMADVWRAEVTGAEGVVKEVALKLVRGEHGTRSDFVLMFIEEARLASRLSHANVVQVFEFDQVEGRYYIAMELVRGRNLVRVVERARELGVKLGLARAVHAGAEAAKGLAYAHRLSEGGRPLGLVHRDVSPHNVLVSFEGEVKLADFGIARAMSQSGLTAPGIVKGKAAYMAPEQARGEVVDARADVFSLGVVLWELCAGRRLFARDSDVATLAALLGSEPPSPPSAWNEEVPPELDAAILAALERDPARRTRSAQELATVLGGILLRLARSPDDWDLRALMHRLWPEGATPAPSPGGEPTRVRTAPVAAESVAGASASEAPPAGAPPFREPAAGEGTAPTRTALSPDPRAPGPRWRLWIAAGIVGVAAAGAIGVGVSRSRPATTPAATPAAKTAAKTATDSDDGRGVIASPAAPPIATRPPPPSPSDAPHVAAPAPSRSGAATAPAVIPGVLVVRAVPWAYVSVDGRELGETPVTIELPSGTHDVRATHPSYGVRSTRIEIQSGRRTTWTASLRAR